MGFLDNLAFWKKSDDDPAGSVEVVPGYEISSCFTGPGLGGDVCADDDVDNTGAPAADQTDRTAP